MCPTQLLLPQHSIIARPNLLNQATPCTCNKRTHLTQLLRQERIILGTKLLKPCTQAHKCSTHTQHTFLCSIIIWILQVSIKPCKAFAAHTHTHPNTSPAPPREHHHSQHQAPQAMTHTHMYRHYTCPTHLLHPRWGIITGTQLLNQAMPEPALAKHTHTHPQAHTQNISCSGTALPAPSSSRSSRTGACNVRTGRHTPGHAQHHCWGQAPQAMLYCNGSTLQHTRTHTHTTPLLLR